MYAIDKLDRVVGLIGVPQSSIGAPCPLVVADEGRFVLLYYIDTRDPEWDGTSVRVVDPDKTEDAVAIVRFERHYATMFGPPNDEAFDGHPLAARGLKPYSAFVIEQSSWTRRLERMNSVHEHHDPASFEKYRHFVFAFHDSTFECVAERYEIERAVGPIRSLISRF